MHYAATSAGAFQSVERIMRDVNWGWLLGYMHANGASFFFIAVYCRIFRGLYYGSYKQPREVLWILGVIIFLLMMATAFMGYVLPWGQMSFWGATVITGFFTVFPVIGDPISGLDQSEDCQNLSITLPADLAPDERLPVMVWIHGGSYVSGAGDSIQYDATSLVSEQRVVFVAVTYRLGLLGYLGGPSRPANLGLLDQITEVCKKL